MAYAKEFGDQDLLVAEKRTCGGQSLWGPVAVAHDSLRVGEVVIVSLGPTEHGLLWTGRQDCVDPESACNEYHAGWGGKSSVFLTLMNPAGQMMAGLCNDGLCGEGEDCKSCPKDCGPCEP
jgi:hypothetical protein